MTTTKQQLNFAPCIQCGCDVTPGTYDTCDNCGECFWCSDACVLEHQRADTCLPSSSSSDEELVVSGSLEEELPISGQVHEPLPEVQPAVKRLTKMDEWALESQIGKNNRTRNLSDGTAYIDFCGPYQQYPTWGLQAVAIFCKMNDSQRKATLKFADNLLADKTKVVREKRNSSRRATELKKKELKEQQKQEEQAKLEEENTKRTKELAEEEKKARMEIIAEKKRRAEKRAHKRLAKEKLREKKEQIEKEAARLVEEAISNPSQWKEAMERAKQQAKEAEEKLEAMRREIDLVKERTTIMQTTPVHAGNPTTPPAYNPKQKLSRDAVLSPQASPYKRKHSLSKTTSPNKTRRTSFSLSPGKGGKSVSLLKKLQKESELLAHTPTTPPNTPPFTTNTYSNPTQQTGIIVDDENSNWLG